MNPTMEAPQHGDHFGSPFPYPFILLGLTIYYFVEAGLKLACRRFKPDFYDQLRREERSLPFFGFAMGWIITLYSSPVCMYAFITSFDEPGM